MKPSRIFFALLISIPAGFFLAWKFLDLTAYPALIDRFFLVFIPSLSICILSLQAFPTTIQQARNTFNSLLTTLYSLISTSPYGILSAVIVFIIELFIASELNHPALEYNANLFESDAGQWITIFASPESGAINRSVHPLSLILIRPLFRLAAILLGGNIFLASILTVSAASGLIVFMAFIFVKRAANSNLYAFLFSILLGLSASHLVFGALTENYIFGGAALIFFLLLVQSREERMSALVPAGILLFGITITNIAQGIVILFIILLLRKNEETSSLRGRLQSDKAISTLQTRSLWEKTRNALARTGKFAVTVVSCGVLLTVFTSALYPNAQTLFFVPRDLSFEMMFVNQEAGKFSNPVNFSDPRSVASKAALVARTMFFYSVIGPEPVATISNKPPFPTIDIRTFDIRAGKLASYKGFANLSLALWILILLGAVLMFFKEFRASKHTPLMVAIGGVLAFNFLLHMFYGTELFLYSPYWTYALVLFVALAFSRFAENRLAHFLLSSFLFLFLLNNYLFTTRIYAALAPFYEAMP